MGKRRGTFKFLKIWTPATDSTALFLGKGAAKIQLREVGKSFAEIRKKMIKRKEGEISCSDGGHCLGAINNFFP